MIQFKEWHLTWDGAPVAMQFDSGSVPLEIRGELPEGYDWEVLMEAPEGGLNILTLEQVSGGGQVLLQREDLPRVGSTPYSCGPRPGLTARCSGTAPWCGCSSPEACRGTRRGRRSPPSLRSWSSGCSG